MHFFNQFAGEGRAIKLYNELMFFCLPFHDFLHNFCEYSFIPLEHLCKLKSPTKLNYIRGKVDAED